MSIKSFGELRSDVAKEMWAIWCPIKPQPLVPSEFYDMAAVAIRMTNAEFDKLIAEKIKERLEDLYEA